MTQDNWHLGNFHLGQLPQAQFELIGLLLLKASNISNVLVLCQNY